jgi:hypothetical protein
VVHGDGQQVIAVGQTQQLRPQHQVSGQIKGALRLFLCQLQRRWLDALPPAWS